MYIKEKHYKIALIFINKKTRTLFEFEFFVGTSGDTKLFEKPSNINGFRASEQKNILYIPPH